MVSKEEFYYNSRDMESKLHAVKWIPEGEIKAVLQLAHGMVEYIDRYDNFARFMAEQGFLVVGNDHLGHGKSVKTDEDYGYFCKKDPETVVIRDIHRLKKITQEENPGKPYFLLGHSMGSFFIRKYMTIYGTGVDGILLLGTGNRKQSDITLGLWVSAILSKIRGDRYRSEFIKNVSFKGYNSHYDNVRTENDWLSRDTNIVDAYNAEKMCQFTFTCNAYNTFFKIMKYDFDNSNLEKIPKDLPIYMAAGEEDPVGGYGKEVKLAYENFKAAGIKDITLKLYPQDRHEILNELDKNVVYKDILNWLNNKIEEKSQI